MTATVSAIAMDEQTLAAERDAFVQRMLRDVSGLFSIYTIYLGHRLGLYRSLASDGSATAGELARRTGTHERYVREWLEQQTVAGILRVDDEAAPAARRRFSLPAGHAEALTDTGSLDYMAPVAQLAVGAASAVRRVAGAFRTGEGVPFEEYGSDLRQGQGDMNRAIFLNLIGGDWFPKIPGLEERLNSNPPARVADVGCGVGWSSIGIAQAYPKVHVHGLDLDRASIHDAQRNVAEAGLADRVTLHCRDAGDPDLAGRYDLVTAFEALHDMADPVSALSAMRRLVAPGGTVLVVDERVGDRFTATGNDVEWMMYGWSVLHCLPVGMGEGCRCGGTGTVMRTDTLRRYATAAGFRDVEVLPIEHFFFRLYRLIQ